MNNYTGLHNNTGLIIYWKTEACYIVSQQSTVWYSAVWYLTDWQDDVEEACSGYDKYTCADSGTQHLRRTASKWAACC